MDLESILLLATSLVASIGGTIKVIFILRKKREKTLAQFIVDHAREVASDYVLPVMVSKAIRLPGFTVSSTAPTSLQERKYSLSIYESMISEMESRAEILGDGELLEHIKEFHLEILDGKPSSDILARRMTIERRASKYGTI